MSGRLPPEMLRILRELDVDSVREDFVAFVGEPPDAILASLHKARLMHRKPFTRAELSASANWLHEHGYELPGGEA